MRVKWSQVAFGASQESWVVLGTAGRQWGWHTPERLANILRGRNNVEFVSLGFGDEYFVRFENGSYSVDWGYDIPYIAKTVRDLKRARRNIRAIVFGDNGNYMVRYN